MARAVAPLRSLAAPHHRRELVGASMVANYARQCSQYYVGGRKRGGEEGVGCLVPLYLLLGAMTLHRVPTYFPPPTAMRNLLPSTKPSHITYQRVLLSPATDSPSDRTGLVMDSPMN